MASSSSNNPNQNRGIFTAQLNLLLELIQAPPDRTGLLDALTELLSSAKRILSVAPASHALNDLVLVLENAVLLGLNNPKPDRDLNTMYGLYADYPLYSVYTQRKSMHEGVDFTDRFHLVSGLLLASIWLSNPPWNPIEDGYTEFLSDLRKIRRNRKWSLLLDIDLKSESIQDLLVSFSSQSKSSRLLFKIHDLVSRVSKGLNITADPTTTNHLTPPPSPTGPEPVKPPTLPYDLGDNDEWVVGKKKRKRTVVTVRPPAIQPQQIVLRKPSPHQRGKDNAETGATATVAQAPSKPNDSELTSSSLEKLQVLDTRFATEYDNQFLPYSWEVLNEYEVTSIVDALKSILLNIEESSTVRYGALIAGLSIVTSRSPIELAQFRLIDSFGNDKPADPAISINHACWYSPFPPLDRFEPSDEQTQWLRPVGDGCYLPLPIELLSELKAFSGKGQTLSEALGCSAEEFNYLAQGFCRNVRLDTKSRANVSWLRGIMFHKLLALTGDDVGSIATLGNTEHAPSVGLYYATFEQSKWRYIYSRALSSLNLTPSVVEHTDGLPYGSRQYPDESKLREWITSFTQDALDKCKKAKSACEIIEGHNYYAGHLFLMLLACTGHRPANQFTFTILCIDLENGWIIISDKITSSATRVRLIPLPVLVIKQLKNYLLHLRNLSKRLISDHSQLADKISMLAEAPVRPLMPFLFWLNEDFHYSEIDIPTFKERYKWPIEGNAFRHFLATGLRNNETLAEYIAILLGHVGIGQFGFGKFSTLSPLEWKEQILPALSLLLESQGWTSIAGLTHPRTIQPYHDSQRSVLEQSPVYDCFTRVSAHVKESKTDRQVVRAAFVAAKQRTPPDCPKDEFLAVFRNEIINRSIDAEDRLAKRLNFHTRFIRMHRHALNPSTIPGWASDMQGDDNPFQPDTLTMAKTAMLYREIIPDISKEFASFSHHERVALVQISSVLFGAVLRIDLVDEIPSKLNGCVRWFGECLWIDFDDKKSGGVQRWFPDPVTALLIARHITQFEPDNIVTSKHLRQSRTKLLDQMRLGLHGNVIEIPALADLIKIGKAFFALNLPGLLRAYAIGDVRSASLTEGCWIRLLSGLPLIVQENEAVPERGCIQPLRHSSQDLKSAFGFLKLIFDAIRNAFPASTSGATNLKGARKNSLTKISKSLNEIAATNPGAPSIINAILSWALHLATEGSIIVREPAPGTIYSYVTDISYPLVEFCSEVDFLELTDAELIDIYQRVINSGSKNTRSSRAQSLRWFHDYCEEEFDITDVDWNEIAPGLTMDRSKVSANIITFPEYCLSKSMIDNHPRLNKRDRQMHLVALILIYRCGLRLGELLRLTVSDLIFHDKCVLLVRNGIYGKTKTRSGIRQVPWLDNLDDNEKSIVLDWIEHRKVVANGDPWGALFGIAEESRILEVRANLSRVLVDILRFVTGDPSIKIHHLRHGVGTSSLAICLSTGRAGIVSENISGWFGSKPEYAPIIARQFCNLHLGIASPTRRIVYAISQALGHASPRTTCWHYGHLLDYSLHEHTTKLVSLKNIDISHLSGMNQNALGAAVFKSPGKSPAELALAWLLKGKNGLSPEIQLANQPITPDSVPPPTLIHPLTSPKLAHIILEDLSSSFTVEKIAGRHAFDVALVKLLADCSDKLERKTGYRKFRFLKDAHLKGDNISFLERKRQLEKVLSGHAIDLLEHFQSALENPKVASTLGNGIKAWLDHYQNNHRGLRISNLDDQNKFLELLHLIGISNEQVALVGNAFDLLSETNNAAHIRLPDGNLVQRSPSFRTAKRIPLGSSRAPTVLVTSTSQKLRDSARTQHGGASLAMKKLHHICFLVAVIQDANSNILNYRESSS